LLKLATRLFVSKDGHTRSEMVMFEELCVQLLRITDLKDRVEIAGMLARCDEVPRSVTRALLHDIYPVASVMLEQSASIDDLELLSLIGTAPSGHLELIAGRRELSDHVVEALLNKMAPEALPSLLANRSVRLPASAIAYLIDLGRDHRGIALALAERLDDVQDVDLIDLFMVLDGRGRRRVIQALEIAALREFAARRPLPRVPLPDTELVAELSRVCLGRDTAAMSELLGRLIGVPADFALRLVADKGGEPLAIALKAVGVDGAVATRVILFSGEGEPRAYTEVKRLVDLYEMVSMRSAVLLIDNWRGARHDIPARPTYVAQSAAGTPVRTATPARTTAPSEVESQDRRRGRA
jgi:uncharacterized protein (DUF2336 family)